ncbi:glycoside hydrolase family 31 protein [Annulohypoxylon nitens]|nr:glycoside hydrolase family 31 protein [Annulohypoxylon nitens]
MKFRDGMWAVAEGVRVEYAEEVYDITETDKGLSLLCPTKKIRGRGDTLNCSTLTIDLEAPHDGIISVETTHWSGAARKGPNFSLFPQGGLNYSPKVTKSDKGTTLTSGSLSATINPTEHVFGIQFHGDKDPAKVLTSLSSRSVGLAYSPAWSNMLQTGDMTKFAHYVFTQTNLSVGETIHGLGERFGAFNKVGQAISLWNADGGTSSEQAYKNVSFFLSSRGYGVFIDTPGRVELEIGSERCCRTQTSVEGQRLKWYIIYGPTPKEVLYRYSVLTGRPSKVPGWSYGLWLTTSFTTNYDEATVTSFLEGMKERDIQVDVFHYDCFWMKGFKWTDFIFDSEKFPDPKASIARLKSSGLVSKVCVWINPYIAQHGVAFAHAAEKGYLVKRKNGDIWQWDLWQAGMGLVDFTNPEAVKWYTECLNELFDKGVDCLKTDFGERIPTLDVQWFDKDVDPHKMHNYYAYLYNKIVYNALQARYGKNQAVLFARAACAGTQQFPLVWGGDCESTPEAMAESIRGGLSLGLSGFTFWSNDIGGFEGSPPSWLYKRWVAFGLLCSHSRLHGSGSYRVPWLIDNDDRSPTGCSSILAQWTALKTRLMPYLMAQGTKAVEQGLPMSMRAMCVEFPEDPTSWYLDRQFMIGEKLLAAPVFEESGEVEFYLPKGMWTCFFTNRTRKGPGWFRERHGFSSMPLYVRGNAILVLGKQGIQGAAYDYTTDVEVVLFGTDEDSGAASTDVVDGDGKVLGTLNSSLSDGGIKFEGSELLKGNWTRNDYEGLSYDNSYCGYWIT